MRPSAAAAVATAGRLGDLAVALSLRGPLAALPAAPADHLHQVDDPEDPEEAAPSGRYVGLVRHGRYSFPVASLPVASPGPAARCPDPASSYCMAAPAMQL